MSSKNDILAVLHRYRQGGGGLAEDAANEIAELCAKICDEVAKTHRTTRKSEGASLCAARIRALAPPNDGRVGAGRHDP